MVNALERDNFYQFGYEKFGPFLMGFTEWLHTSAENDGVEKLFFFSRDGFVMQKAFQKLQGISKCTIADSYAYFSRKSLRTALLWTCKDYKESLKYLSVSRYISIAAILDYYGFDDEERCDISKDMNLDLTQEVSYDSLVENSDIQAVYQVLQKDIHDKSSLHYEYLREYVLQLDMCGKFGIVDIGWYGNMQLYLEEFFNLADISVEMYGYYVGICPRAVTDMKLRGYLYSPENLKLRKRTLCFFGVWERLFQSKEGSTIGYERRDGQIVPLLDLYEYEDCLHISSTIDSLQLGAFDYVNTHRQNSLSFSDAVTPLLRFGAFPTGNEVEMFQDFYNVDGNRIYYLPQKRLHQYTMGEFLHALSNSVWKPGFMKAAFRLPLPYYWVYAWMRR